MIIFSLNGRQGVLSDRHYITSLASLLFYCFMCACSAAQSCPSLCDPMNYRPPGSSVHKSSQVGILGRLAIFYPTGIFPAQGKNPHLLQLLDGQADSVSLCHLVVWFQTNYRASIVSAFLFAYDRVLSIVIIVIVDVEIRIGDIFFSLRLNTPYRVNSNLETSQRA